MTLELCPDGSNMSAAQQFHSLAIGSSGKRRDSFRPKAANAEPSRIGMRAWLADGLGKHGQTGLPRRIDRSYAKHKIVFRYSFEGESIRVADFFAVLPHR